VKRIVGELVEIGPDRARIALPGFPAHRPGQFAMLHLDPELSRRDPLLPRPMAIYRRSGDVLEFRFKVVGRGTAALARAPRGARLAVVGPLGNGFSLPAGPSVLVGGGTGIASLYELASQAPGPVQVVLGGRSRAEVLGLADFEVLPVELRVATEDGSAGHRGLVTELLELRAEHEVLACGPHGMLARVQQLAQQAGARCRVSLESPMACGFGICLGCVIPTRAGLRYVCTHGPVFDAGDLEWEARA
jgi:dihydroorotate dehydrogenase electron transfer subunit